ncbi:MAG TPA: hypothetical protein VFQ44_01885 [Streptosporangiaceae bacterium]|nr:hypothetical protein [Streptosporangiaceae bacterium]
MSEPQPEEPCELPGTEPAPEPGDFPDWPFTAADAAPLIAKVIG